MLTDKIQTKVMLVNASVTDMHTHSLSALTIAIARATAIVCSQVNYFNIMFLLIMLAVRSRVCNEHVQSIAKVHPSHYQLPRQ